jgi:hypothetical protein
LDEKTRAIVPGGTEVGVFPQIVAGKKKIKRITKKDFFMMRPPIMFPLLSKSNRRGHRDII